MDALLRVGVIVKAHGIRGEVKVYPTTDSAERFSLLKSVRLKSAGTDCEAQVESVRFFKNLVILKLSGIEDPETAERFRGAELYVRREEGVPLSENEYYIADIIGLSVFDEDGNCLGTVRDVLQTGANDVYAVAREGKKDLLIPAIRSCVLKVCPEDGRMDIRLIPGLLDL